METNRLDQIDTLFEQRKKWSVKSIPLTVIEDVKVVPRVTKEWNLADHIGKASGGSRSDKGGKIYLADFQENTDQYRKDVVLPAIRKACRPEGFFAVAKGYKEKKKKLQIECTGPDNTRGVIDSRLPMMTVTMKAMMMHLRLRVLELPVIKSDQPRRITQSRGKRNARFSFLSIGRKRFSCGTSTRSTRDAWITRDTVVNSNRKLAHNMFDMAVMHRVFRSMLFVNVHP